MSYSYSTDDEQFHGKFDTPEQAAIEGFAKHPELQAVEIGEAITHPAEHYVSARSIVDDMKCAADDTAGEAAEDWLDYATEEQLAELEALVAAWAKEVDPPNFWGIGNTHTITRAELIAKGLLEDAA